MGKGLMVARIPTKFFSPASPAVSTNANKAFAKDKSF